jgi:hypothetical protein
MKYFNLTLLFIIISTYSFGQSFEWEILNLGIPFGFQKDKSGDVIWNQDKGAAIGTEIRYNYLGKRLSSGIQLSFTGWNRRSSMRDYDFSKHQNPFIFLLVTDYNFLEINPKKISPFAGMGIGYASIRSWPLASSEEEKNVKSHFACSPRVGVEFFKRIRLTTEYQYLGKGNSFFNVKLGFVVGS